MDETYASSGAVHTNVEGCPEPGVIDLAREPDFTIGELRFQPATRQLFVGQQSETLEPRVMQVLALLASRRSTVVSRDELVERCWAGRAVSEHAINRCIAKVRHLADVHGGFSLETIPRVGYRLNERRPAASPTRRFRPLAVAAALMLVALGAVLWLTVLRDRSAPQEPVSLAVLPFRDLSRGNDYFAEGVSEEIMTELSRQGLRVAGRTSSSMFKDRGADLRDVGRSLGVSYLLEGSVRRSGDRMRIHVALVNARDGMRLWSQVFDGTLDDVLVIQQNISREVAGRLHAGLRSSPFHGQLATAGDVYALYLTARGLLRTRDLENVRTATQLLRRATRADPGFAPAWSSLAAALYLGSWADWPPKRSEANAYADRALSLAPNLAEAHAVKGLLLGSNRDAVRHLERAVRLQPDYAEAWLWLATAYGRELAYEKALGAIRRCAQLDPFWSRCAQFSDAAWEIGEREASQRFDTWLLQHLPEPSQRERVRAKLAVRRGDWSGHVLHLQRVVELDSGDGRLEATIDIRHALIWLGLPSDDYLAGLEPVAAKAIGGELPKLSAILGTLAEPKDFWNVPMLSVVAPRLFLNEGRAAELVWLYDQSFSSPKAFASHAFEDASFISHAPTMALALREANRDAEAQRILREASQRVRRAAQQPRVPASVLVSFARVWAVDGQRDQAINALERAFRAGWPAGVEPQMAWIGRPIISDEPAFRTLRHDARFRRIDAAIRAHLERERRELQQALQNG